MHNLAIALAGGGYQVSGSDDVLFEPSRSRLEEWGILPPQLGWFPEKISKDLDIVILGMHAQRDNPELLKAQDLGLRIYSYPEFLYSRLSDKTRVVIAGSHGKTTITSMIIHVLNFLQKDVDYAVGAQLEGFDCMVRLTERSDFAVLEGDEYLSSVIDSRPKFLHYMPNIALLSGISWDHINVFKTSEDYVDQFQKLVSSITSGGVLVYNMEDEQVSGLLDSCDNFFRKIGYKTPDYEIKDGQSYVITGVGKIPLLFFGKHNLLNMEGARLICQQLGVMEEDFFEAMMSFRGASGRLERVERKDGAKVYRDFAHAPSKVKASVEAFVEQFPGERTCGFLELHTYSSLNADFLEQYASSLNALDQALVFYSEEVVRRKGMPVLSPSMIKDSFKREDVEVFTDVKSLKAYWEALDKNKTAYLMMSSGNFGGLDLKR